MRRSQQRWQGLQGLLARLERLTQTALSLDLAGNRQARSWRISEAARFERRLARLHARIDLELVRLTCEGLASELKQQQRKDRT